MTHSSTAAQHPHGMPPAGLYPMRPRTDDQRLRRGRGFPLRTATAHLRALPDFLIVGAMKSGTSSLFNYLSQHPLIVPPVRKETHYFSLGYRLGKGEDWYRAHFPLKIALNGGKITGEATPGYMFEPDVPARIAKALPAARIIVVLRNPVERAISHYAHEVAMGREYLPFEDAIACEEDRLAAAMAAGEEGYETFIHASYKKRGLYFEQIHFLEQQFDRDQIMILGSGALFAKANDTMEELSDFLGLPGMPVPYDFTARNRSDEKPSVPQSAISALQQYFAEPNEKLFAHLGRELAW